MDATFAFQNSIEPTLKSVRMNEPGQPWLKCCRIAEFPDGEYMFLLMELGAFDRH